MAKAAKKPAKRKPPPKAKAEKPEKPKGGRPSKYSAGLVESICSRLAKGEPLAVICRDEGMPADRTVYDWMEARPDVSAAIARAREVGFDALAAGCLEIAEDGSRDFVLAKTGPILDTEHVQRSKLRIDTRLKLLAKWDPKRYGERLQHANDPDNPMPGAVTFLVMPTEPAGKPE